MGWAPSLLTEQPRRIVWRGVASRATATLKVQKGLPRLDRDFQPTGQFDWLDVHQYDEVDSGYRFRFVVLNTDADNVLFTLMDWHNNILWQSKRVNTGLFNHAAYLELPSLTGVGLYQLVSDAPGTDPFFFAIAAPTDPALGPPVPPSPVPSENPVCPPNLPIRWRDGTCVGIVGIGGCPSGQVWSALLNRCVPACPAGQSFHVATERCEAVTVPPGPPPGGQQPGISPAIILGAAGLAVAVVLLAGRKT